MSYSEIKTLAPRIFDEIWNRKNSAMIDELISPDLIFDVPGGHLQGLAGYKAVYDMYVSAFPDCQFIIEDTIIKDDQVVLRFSFTGTHLGELMGIPATGKTAKVPGVAIARYKGDKVVENWVYWDNLILMQQLNA